MANNRPILAAMGAAEDRRRIESAVERLARLTRSPRAHAIRSARAGVHLTRAGENVLRHLAERGELRIGDLARATHTGDAAVSRTVSALEEAGLVRRESAREDGRVALVRLTAQGRGVTTRLRRAADEILRDLLSQWSARELSRAAGIIDRLACDLSRSPDAGHRTGASP